MNKRQLYESIMRNVSREVKKALNEANNINMTNDEIEKICNDIRYNIDQNIDDIMNEYEYWTNLLFKMNIDIDSIGYLKERLKCIKHALNDLINANTYMNNAMSYNINKDTYENICRSYLKMAFSPAGQNPNTYASAHEIIGICDRILMDLGNGNTINKLNINKLRQLIGSIKHYNNGIRKNTVKNSEFIENVLQYIINNK